MFSAGTRAYVHISAFSGKKLGPKRHSLGFVSEGEHVFIADHVRDFPDPKQSFILIPMHVVFTRFGKERKSRVEAKSFLNILPVFYSNFEDTETRTLKVLNCLRSGELHTNSAWQELVHEYAGRDATVGVMTTIQSYSPSAMDANNTEAWVSSVLRNRYFTYLVMRNRNLPTLIRALYPHDNLLVWIANAVRDASPRRDLMKWSHESSQNMAALVVTLRKMTTIFNKSFGRSSAKGWSKSISAGNFNGSDVNSFTSWVVSGMLDNPGNFKDKMDLISKNYKKIPSRIFALSKTLPGVRAAYLSLKPKHI